MIAAIGLKNEIGRANDLVWKNKEDMAHFKKVTAGKVIVMGRKTHESIGMPLPGRTNLVLSRDPAFWPDGVVVLNKHQVLSRADHNKEMVVIGGEAVYRQFMPLADKLYITQVHAEYAEADTFFPAINHDEWRLASHTPRDGFDFLEFIRC